MAPPTVPRITPPPAPPSPLSNSRRRRLPTLPPPIPPLPRSLNRRLSLVDNSTFRTNIRNTRIQINSLLSAINNLQTENKISIVIADHQARDLLTCVDSAIILHNTTIVASGTPNQLMDNKQARNAYFGESFKFN